MPRPSKGARLYLRKPRRDSAGVIVKAGGWVILDNGREHGTGCGPADCAEAERKLLQYLAEKHETPRGERPLSEVKIADVLTVYLRDIAPEKANPAKIADASDRLLDFFGERTLIDIDEVLCRAYVAHREAKGHTYAGNGGGARRDLQDLAAAINHHQRKRLHSGIVAVTLPERGQSRKRWLTRSEVAKLVWVCLSTREVQDGRTTKKRPLHHLARFILTGIYTGSRPGAILGLSWHQEIGRGWIDLDHGMIYRMKEGAKATNKRQPPVPMAPELARLMRLWGRADNRFGPLVRFNGEAMLSVKVALKRACKLAGLDSTVTAYTLRHTAASWLVQRGMSFAKVAAFLGTSEAMIDRHYAHLAPDHLRDVADMIGRKRRA